MIDDGAFVLLARTAERIGATTKRLEKAAILGEYLSALNDSDLARATRYLSGYAFPLRDQRTTNVGGSALIGAILAASSADEAQVRSRLVQLGDAGDVVYEIFERDSTIRERPPRMSLADVAAFLEELAQARGTRLKAEIVTHALERAAPLEAKYLVKLLLGDHRIGLKEGAVEDAIARLFGVPIADVQRENMLTGDIGETAVHARHGSLGEARMRLFHPLKFMLATPAADLADVARQMPASGFIVEDKFDGIRAQAHIAPIGSAPDTAHGVEVNGRRVALFSRTLDEITPAFPDLASALAELLPEEQGESGGIILDGEIVPIAPSDRTDSPSPILPFQALQPRLGRKSPSEQVQRDAPVAFIAYDILYAGGHALFETPLEQRRRRLVALPFDGVTVRLADSHVFTDVAPLDAEFDAARSRGNEGLMIKDPASFYKPGRRGREWLKIKRATATLDVVVTAAQVGEGRRSRFLSDYTFAVRASETDPALLNVGKAYSGLTDAEIQELSDWFKAHTLAEYAHGKVRIVEPRIVFEVTFDLVQPSTRHKSGFALRFPRILRIRTDKAPEEIDTLETVRRLAGLHIDNADNEEKEPEAAADANTIESARI